MPSGPGSEEFWDQLWNGWQQLQQRLRRSKATNVNTSSLRAEARELVELYFRHVRAELAGMLGDAALESLDDGMQDLLRLAQGRNARTSYLRTIRAIGSQRTPLAIARERHFGRLVESPGDDSPDMAFVEREILRTLQSMLPDAGLSYEQAVRDLQSDRASYRGTAVELREVVRETLDHLAPDSDVTQEPGFKLEKDRVGPTMRQKAQFILRSRGLSATQRKAPHEAVSIVDELTASFVRSAYERGSAATHSAPARSEVERLKLYVDTVLTELLATE